ncbi:MAG TPA: TonB-dependent receptor plug domain-containing protein [Vicinamibacterales bacterium]|nr:TonB-dependent receptor plug domain-containing protein [Vicinamibacterales bacterium]
MTARPWRIAAALSTLLFAAALANAQSPGDATPLQVTETVVVTAAASGVPQSQTGAPVTVLDSRTLDALNKIDVAEALRLVPGAQVVQEGARGGTTSLFMRGGNGTFNKVLVDGIPVNDIGGGFDYAHLTVTGIDHVEVLRQTNSVVYGSDALAGVVALTTTRGRTRVPEVTWSADGGNLATYASTASIGGVAGRVDYYSAYSRFGTDNRVPNNAFRNGTYAGRFGVGLGHATDLSGTIRRIDATYGSANAFGAFGIADDSRQTNAATYAGVSLQSQVTNRWQTAIRFGSADQTVRFVNPGPTGEPFDPFGFGPNYLGRVVTLRGANGDSVTGQAILDYGGAYPSAFANRSTRRLLSGDATYDVSAALTISAGARYEGERGYSDPEGAPDVTRDNGGVFAEARARVGGRHYITAGLGYEHNAAFGSAVTPRISLASYVRTPAEAGGNDTKIVLNAGTGIKAPDVFEQQSSLFELLRGTPAGDGLSPIGPERARSFDVGLEQGLAHGRARARVSYFRNSFRDLIEFLSQSALPLAGVPAEVAAATPSGAYVNSQSYRAQGLELSFDAALPYGVRARASYTYLDAVVTKAFSATASFNPLFPSTPIGAYSPLVGARPFRRPANSGSLMLMYTRGPGEVVLSGYFAGVRDDSTFLSDPYFGPSMLLPNHDLDPAYQKIDLSAAYQVRPRLRGYVSIENVLDQTYAAAFGYPALPLTARVGVRLTLGGR